MAGEKKVDVEKNLREVKHMDEQFVNIIKSGKFPEGYETTVQMISDYYDRLEPMARQMKKNGYTIEDGIQCGDRSLRDALKQVNLDPSKMDRKSVLRFAAVYMAGTEMAARRGESVLPLYVHLPENGKIQPKPLQTNAMIQRKEAEPEKEELTFLEWLCKLLHITTSKDRYHQQMKEVEGKAKEISASLDADFQKKMQEIRPAALDKVETKDRLKYDKEFLTNSNRVQDRWKKLFFGDRAIEKMPKEWVFQDGTKLDPLTACMGILASNLSALDDPVDIWKLSPEKVAKNPVLMEEVKDAVKEYETFQEQRVAGNSVDDSFKHAIDTNAPMGNTILSEKEEQVFLKNPDSKEADKIMSDKIPIINMREQLLNIVDNRDYQPDYFSEAARARYKEVQSEYRLHVAVEGKDYQKAAKHAKENAKNSLICNAVKKMAQECAQKEYVETDELSGSIQAVRDRAGKTVEELNIGVMMSKEIAAAADTLLSGRWKNNCHMDCKLNEAGKIKDINVIKVPDALEVKDKGLENIAKEEKKLENEEPVMGI